MSVNKQYLVDIRRELHEDIHNMVTNAEYTALRVVREPNSYKIQPSPKIIVVVKTNKKAEELKSKCFNLIESANNDIKNELKGTVLPRYEIKYSINIINAASDILLSVHDAQRRKKMSGSDVKARLELLKIGLNKEKFADIIGDIDTCIKEICDTGKYILAKSTGNSYRVTYFNGNHREQMSVGNLLIVVNSENIQIVNAPARKKRADKKKCLYCLNSGYRTICIYPV